MDDAVSGAQGYATTIADKVWQRVLSIDINRFRIGGSMAERLHGEVGRKAKAREVLQLITRHGASGVLGADCRHLWFTVGARPDTLYAAGAANHFLGKRKSGVCGFG